MGESRYKIEYSLIKISVVIWRRLDCLKVFLSFKYDIKLGSVVVDSFWVQKRGSSGKFCK